MHLNNATLHLEQSPQKHNWKLKTPLGLSLWRRDICVSEEYFIAFAFLWRLSFEMIVAHCFFWDWRDSVRKREWVGFFYLVVKRVRIAFWWLIISRRSADRLSSFQHTNPNIRIRSENFSLRSESN